VSVTVGLCLGDVFAFFFIFLVILLQDLCIWGQVC
jgi:hypothetical protein